MGLLLVFACGLFSRSAAMMIRNNLSNGNADHEFVWNTRHQQELFLAQQGIKKYLKSLYSSMQGFLEGVHSHTQDGLYPTNFGRTFNYNGRTFEEASGDVFELFRKCVKDYRSAYNVPFPAYVVKMLKHRAKDWVRDRTNEREVREGQRLNDDGDCLTHEGYEAACSSYYEERSLSLYDPETHPVEYVEIKDLIEKVKRKVVASGDLTLIQFIKVFEECIDFKNAVPETADRMGVVRATIYNYLDRLRALLRDEFAEYFALAA